MIFIPLIVVTLFFGMGMQGALIEAEAEEVYGEIAHKHLNHLAKNIGERVAGTVGDWESRDYIYRSFEQLGYNSEIQPFSYTNRGNTVDTSNIIAVKPGSTDQQIIIGAHYDTVKGVEGVEDNASSIGVMLEVAERIKNIDLPYTVRFVAFGAEESGLKGSNYYVSHMTKPEIDKTKVMINMDSLIVGDYMYVYGGLGAKGWVRELGLNIGKDLGIQLQTNPGLNPLYPKGTTGSWSDHAPFERKGITYAYLEATNWEIGDLDGYTQTKKHGGIWHDPQKDNMAFITTEFPKRFENRLGQFSEVLNEMVLELMPSINNMKAQINVSRENKEIVNDSVARLMQTHLISVAHYHGKGLTDKAIKHMNGFNLLIEQLKDGKQVSEKAYNSLKADADSILSAWQ